MSAVVAEHDHDEHDDHDHGPAKRLVEMDNHD